MIATEETGGIRTIRMAHGKVNALDVEMLEALRAELLGAHSARAVIITGTASVFSAGVDLFRVLEGGAEYVRRFYPALCTCLMDLFNMPIPVIAATNGHAIAGGGIITMAADYRIMAAGSGRIGIPELPVGVRLPAVALEIARFGVAPHRLQSVIYRGEKLVPEDAFDSGIIDEVVPPERLMERAFDVASELAALPSENFRATKVSLRKPFVDRMKAEGELTDAEVLASWAASETHDRIRAYLATLRK